MLINFQQSVREYNFLRVRNWLVGQIPHVDLLAIFSWNGTMRGELRMGNFTPTIVKGRNEKWIFAPNMIREQAAQTGGKHGQQFVIWGEKKTDSNGNRQFVFEHIRCAARETVAHRSVNIIEGQVGKTALVRGQKPPVRFLENVQSSGDFYIPFIDEITVGIMPEVLNAEFAASVSETNLSKTERVLHLLENVRRYEHGMRESPPAGKDGWSYRGMLLEAMKELEELARW